MTKPVVLLATAAVLVSFAVEAFAHSEIESCHLLIDATTKSALDSIVCTTSEGMDSNGSSLRVFDSTGAQIDKGDSQVDSNNRTTISVSLHASKVRGGIYTVKWKTLSADDGDEATGEFKLTVAE